MKKLALTFGAIVLGFVLTSCGDNKKETVMQLFNTFFDEEVTFLNQVTSAADFLEYDQASDQRLEEFYAKMSQDFPMDENGEIINLGKEDNEEVKKALMAREDAYVNLYDAKRTELSEPYIADLENFWTGELDEFFGQFENEKELTDEKIMPMFQAQSVQPRSAQVTFFFPCRCPHRRISSSLAQRMPRFFISAFVEISVSGNFPSLRNRMPTHSPATHRPTTAIHKRKTFIPWRLTNFANLRASREKSKFFCFSEAKVNRRSQRGQNKLVCFAERKGGKDIVLKPRAAGIRARREKSKLKYIISFDMLQSY